MFKLKHRKEWGAIGEIFGSAAGTTAADTALTSGVANAGLGSTLGNLSASGAMANAITPTLNSLGASGATTAASSAIPAATGAVVGGSIPAIDAYQMAAGDKYYALGPSTNQARAAAAAQAARPFPGMANSMPSMAQNITPQFESQAGQSFSPYMPQQGNNNSMGNFFQSAMGSLTGGSSDTKRGGEIQNNSPGGLGNIFRAFETAPMPAPPIDNSQVGMGMNMLANFMNMANQQQQQQSMPRNPMLMDRYNQKGNALQEALKRSYMRQ